MPRSIATSSAPRSAGPGDSRLYDGHNRRSSSPTTPASRRSAAQVFVNTVPTALPRERRLQRLPRPNGNLIPIYDPLTTRLNPDFNSTWPVSATNPQFLRDPFPDNIIPADRINPVGPQHRQHLPAAERAGQFRQLHLDGRSRDHRPRLLGPRRSPLSGQATRSSCGSTTGSSGSTRRRARPTAACRRPPTPRRASISGRSSPASRTRA